MENDRRPIAINIPTLDVLSCRISCAAASQGSYWARVRVRMAHVAKVAIDYNR